MFFSTSRRKSKSTIAGLLNLTRLVGAPVTSATIEEVAEVEDAPREAIVLEGNLVCVC